MSAAEQGQPDYSLLTQEEIDAMAADPSPDELVTMRQAKDAENLDEDEDESQYEDDGSKIADTENTDNDEAKGDEKTETPTDSGKGSEKPDSRAQYQAQLPEDFQQQSEALKTERAELREAYKNGDIDFDEYEERRESLRDREKELDRAAIKAEIAGEMSQQSEAQMWATTIQNFFEASAKSDGIDYRTDEAKHADLDLFVRTLADKPENADKSGEWFLQEAHKRVKALHGIETVSNKKPGAQNRKPPVDDLPKNLAHVPGGADDAEEQSSRFADLDKLEGIDLETALARLTSDQRDAYLRGL